MSQTLRVICMTTCAQQNELPPNEHTAISVLNLMCNF
jgi:hypothetical protein